MSSGTHGYMPTSNRIRGRKLQDIRARWFAQYPMCAVCHERIAVELDHIHALHLGGAEDEANYQGLCKPCHTAKSLKERGLKPKQTIGSDGWPI
jgi:5-methylcytosine-specific restriction protein A